MKTYTKNIVKIIAAITLVTGSAFTSSAQAGWNPIRDAQKIIRGEKKIKPYIKISHKRHHVRISKNRASIKIGRVSLKTTRLKQRFAQGACIYGTGNVYKCAPDIVNREMRRAQKRIYKTAQYRQYQNYNNQYKNAQRQYRQAQQAYNNFRSW